jgi:hypothetical protein
MKKDTEQTKRQRAIDMIKVARSMHELVVHEEDKERLEMCRQLILRVPMQQYTIATSWTPTWPSASLCRAEKTITQRTKPIGRTHYSIGKPLVLLV